MEKKKDLPQRKRENEENFYSIESPYEKDAVNPSAIGNEKINDSIGGGVERQKKVGRSLKIREGGQ